MAVKIAITGNIASGKSQVERYIQELGYVVYDSDEIAHEVLSEIKDFYGYDVFASGKIDRKKLGKLVFSNLDLKKKLEEATHPKIKEKILELFELHKNDNFIFISVPLLFEAGFESIFDKIILITVDNKLQLSRLMNRNNLTEKEALSRMNSQIPQDKKISKSDYIIENNSTVENLLKQVDFVLSELNKPDYFSKG